MKVTWHEWSDEAFRKAEAEDKPIVLSLDASWSEACRVMDRETYDDPEVAKLLERDYIPLRVDTDRRPDIRERYFLGDWPTTAFLTPSGLLLGGATFVGADQMKQLLVQLRAGYASHKEQIAEEIARRDEKVAQVLQPLALGKVTLTMEIFRKTVRGILGTFDSLHGGFGKAPKLPMAASMRVMLHALYETQGPDFQAVVYRTLDAMGDRALYDHDGGGFFHLTTNEAWTMPRFEKLTETNAELIRLFLDASLVTDQAKYLSRASHALSWVQRTLLDPDRGVFYASQFGDRDFYLSSPRQREGRPIPAVDRTVFIPSTCAMAGTFLRAAQVLGDEAYAQAAIRGLDWVLREGVTSEGVAHYHDGKPRLFTLLGDRLSLAAALLDAHEHTGERRFLEAAEELSGPVMKLFWSEAEQGLVDRAVDALDRGELVQLRRTLSENGRAAENFARLGSLTGNPGHRAAAERLILAFPDYLDGYGHATAEYALGADRLVRPPEEVRAGPGALKAYVPRRVVRHGGR